MKSLLSKFAAMGAALALLVPVMSAQAAPADTRERSVSAAAIDPPEDQPDEIGSTSGKKEPSKKKDEGKQGKKPSASGVTRVAILNFGPPSEWQGTAGNMVGTVVNAKAWEDAIPMLEKDNVDVVVVRINSGGGLLAEMAPFQNLYEKKYKPRFRTVGWVESAISCAAMSPYVLEEFYFMPEGNLGACTGWHGNLEAIKDEGLSDILYRMEQVSAMGKRDPKIMRAMQIQEPLSANIDDNGNVTFFQDESGSIKVNAPKRILTLTADVAEKIKFSRGTAATKEELAKAMGLGEVEWVGKAASDYIDQNMRKNDTAEKKFGVIYGKYAMAVQAAASLQDDRRKTEVGVAKRHLEELKQVAKLNPNLPLLNINKPWGMWVSEQEEYLKDLLKKGKK